MGQLNCLARYKRNIIYRLVSYVSHRSNQTYHVSYIIDDSPVPSNINRLVSSTINYVLCLCVSLSVCRWPPLFSSSTCISYIVMRAHVSLSLWLAFQPPGNLPAPSLAARCVTTQIQYRSPVHRKRDREMIQIRFPSPDRLKLDVSSPYCLSPSRPLFTLMMIYRLRLRKDD